MADRELWSSRRDDGPILLTDNLTVGTPFGGYVTVTYLGTGRRGRLRYSTLRARYDFQGLRDASDYPGAGRG